MILNQGSRRMKGEKRVFFKSFHEEEIDISAFGVVINCSASEQNTAPTLPSVLYMKKRMGLAMHLAMLNYCGVMRVDPIRVSI